jgi:hypothetical protein
MNFSSLTRLNAKNASFFLQNPHAALRKYGANLAGFVWNTGNLSQFLVGAFIFSPVAVIASLFNISSSTSSMVFGHTNAGVRAANILSVIGTGLAVHEGLLNLEPSTWLGYVGFVAAMSLSFWGVSLTLKFSKSPYMLQRRILGYPRRTAGLGIFISRLPIIAASFSHQRWEVFIPMVVWAAGDLLFCASLPVLPPDTKTPK